jgi:hypothetical protein
MKVFLINTNNINYKNFLKKKFFNLFTSFIHDVQYTYILREMDYLEHFTKIYYINIIFKLYVIVFIDIININI